MELKERRKNKEELYKLLLILGAKPANKNMVHCPFHEDGTASSWVKKSADGYWYWKCFTCKLHYDIWDLDAINQGISTAELFAKLGAKEESKPYQKVYATLDELVESIDALVIEEINPYTNPETNNIDLVTIRYLERGGNKKKFAQAHQTPEGFIQKKPKGPLPLFNRRGILTAGRIIFVEGESVARLLTKAGYIATTGSGGSSNASEQDYTVLAGKQVYLWADNDEPGRRYIQDVKERLLELDIKVYEMDPPDVPEGGDAVDLFNRIIAEGGTLEDFQSCIEVLFDEAEEVHSLSNFEGLLDAMRDGSYTNLEIADFPMLTKEAALFLNKRLSVIYGGAGIGKTLLVGKICDDFVLAGYKVARLQLEDEHEQHLLRTFAQQLQRSELASPTYHKSEPEASKLLYETAKPMLDTIAKTIVSGESELWDDKKILAWIEAKMKANHDVIVVDPISVVATDKIWLTMHRLTWETKHLLAKYPNSRVLFISHPGSDGTVAGGLSLEKFCHTMLTLDKLKAPKEYSIVTKDGEVVIEEVVSCITIKKSRYGTGSGLSIAVKLNGSTLCFEERGIMLEEQKPVKKSGLDLNDV